MPSHRVRFATNHEAISDEPCSVLRNARPPGDDSLDPTFGAGGVVVSAIGGGQDTASSVLVQPDGKIVAVGQADNGTHGNNVNVAFAVIRVLP